MNVNIAISTIIGIAFTLFIPGYLFVETFFAKLVSIVKIPLYILLSLLLSTYSIYFVSLFLGFSKVSIILTFLIINIFALFFIVKNKPEFKFPSKHLAVFIFAVISFLLFFIALFPGIFTFHKGDIVMSAENWQDTAMHMGITESISQGNFPPKAPYFSGRSLSYYYFVDFHAAIIETLTGEFFPRTFVYINPFFVSLFALSVYALTWTLTKRKFASLFSSILATLYGNFMFINFLKDLANGGTITGLLANKGYTIDYGGILSVSPMADYFLQNRPMMVGLPAFAIILNLIFIAFKKKERKLFFLIGLIASLFVKFQLFVLLATLVVFPLSVIILGIKKLTFKEILLCIFFLILGLSPGFIFLYLLKAGNSSFFDLIKATFQYKPWAYDKSIVWKILFIIENFGIQFGLIIISFILILTKKIKLTRNIVFVFFLMIILFSLPFFIRFTIYDGDMFKFFYLSVIPISIIGSLALEKIWKKKIIGESFATLIILFSIFTCLLNLGQSFFNKSTAYSLNEYNAGLWIRDNTPQKSVFIEMPVVHSAVTEIGGRLRTLSYINWPYSHGFNVGDDNVFSRLYDIKSFYLKPNSEIIRKYNINFVYLGPDEKNNFTDIEIKLNSAPFLKKVYEQGNIAIYKVDL